MNESKKIKEFKFKLKKLMSEYGCIFTADDYWQGYAECGRDIQIHIEMQGVYSLFEQLEFKSQITADDLD